VAIGSCEDYGPEQVEAAMRSLVALTGGLSEVVHPGDTVVIKPNLTGAGQAAGPGGLPGILTYVTHPDVVRAIALLAKEAGAARIVLAEAQPSTVWAANGYTALLTELGAETLNLAETHPASGFKRVPVASPMVYSDIWMNDLAARADVYVSVSKMKCHVNAGLTLSIKNSVALMPTALYRTNPSDRQRTAIHAGNWSERLPRVLVDLLKARPIEFCVIDGISTMDQGEGPWNQGQAGINLRAVQPGLLIVGRNPVAVDAVGAPCMGFDPQAMPFTGAFLSGWNHIALAAEAGLGPNALDEIEMLGLPLAEAVFSFTACPNQSGITPTPTLTPSVTPTQPPTATPSPTQTPEARRVWLPLLKR
jgi:uncharacterized protein (DUF362 family)